MIGFGVLAVVLAIAGVGLFAGSETAFVSSNRFRLMALSKKGKPGADIALKLISNPTTLLNVTLLGTNICVVVASAIATKMMEASMGSYSILASTLGVTSFILVFGEITPKAFARAHPERFLSATACLLALSYWILYPLALLTTSIASVFLPKGKGAERSKPVTREEIRALFKEIARSSWGVPVHRYAYRVLDLARMKVTSVMVPMDDVVCLSHDMTVGEALKVAEKSGHSRYPVYKGDRDNIVGVLHLKDLLGVPSRTRIAVFARSAYFIPETKTVKQVMIEIRDDIRHLSFVTDEYGRTIGVVTFEDVVEEILGEITDEYDQVASAGVEIGRPLSGNAPISLLREELDIDIPPGSYDTLAGFLLSKKGSIPEVGERIEHGEYVFEIVEVRRRRIRRVIVRRKQSEAS